MRGRGRISGREVLTDVPNPKQQDGEEIQATNRSDGGEEEEDVDAHQAAPPCAAATFAAIVAVSARLNAATASTSCAGEAHVKASRREK